ncbi:glycosyl hydrolase family 3 N terminal domain-containing protein [Aspergillus pseudodeflectus]|uniref:Probable beta-glucosidase G n=1 Tax=Aspergillus pseudodeflectus TaxID=176178 RepID=A0ABR4KHN5_9EURO
MRSPGCSPLTPPSKDTRTGAGGGDPAYERARAFVEELTLAEKADMVTGVAGPCIGNVYPIPCLNFSGICLQDGPVSLRVASNVDDRTLHELYLWSFANAVHTGVAAVMRSYQRLDGSYACQNSKLLNGILKEELGFQGYIMSDWFALHAGIDALEAGMDMDMPGRLRSSTPVPELGQMSSHFGGNITTMVQNSTLDEARLMTPYFHLRQDEQNEFPTVDGCLFSLPQLVLEPEYLAPGLGLFNLTGPTSIRDVHDNHAALIRKQAAESTVLLKNTNNALPLRAPRYIDISGNDAGETQNGPVNHFGNAESWMYGTCVVGGGSATGRLSYVTMPQEALKARAIQDGTLVETWLNNTLSDLGCHEFMVLPRV